MNKTKSKTQSLQSLLLAGLSLLSVGFGKIVRADTKQQEPNAPKLTLAVKYVEFIADDGKPVMTRAQVDALTQGMNQVYGQCGIELRTEQVVEAHPKDYALAYGMTSMGELESIRKPFDDANYLVVVNTGAWDHGSLGPANAWTTMPGTLPSGAVIESEVATDAPLVAHELGHYLGLDHASNQSNLMNPVIYADSKALSSDQCVQMREIATTTRKAALRA